MLRLTHINFMLTRAGDNMSKIIAIHLKCEVSKIATLWIFSKRKISKMVQLVFY